MIPIWCCEEVRRLAESGKYMGLSKGIEGYMAKCPAHEDSTASLSIGFTEDKILLKCHAGCEHTAIASALGIKPVQLFKEQAHKVETKPGLTLAMLEATKKIPADTLREYGLVEWKNKERGDCIAIPYFDEEGNQIVHDGKKYFRLRLVMEDTKREKVVSMKGMGAHYVYGLNRAMSSKSKEIWITEGESDCWTLWYSGRASIGLPGASTFSLVSHIAPILSGFDTVYVSQEPGEAGQKFADEVVKRLIAEQVGVPCYTVKWQEYGIKDPSDLFIRMEGEASIFSERVRQICEEVKERHVKLDAKAIQEIMSTTKTDYKIAQAISRVQQGEMFWDGASNKWFVWSTPQTRWRRSNSAVYKSCGDIYELLNIPPTQAKITATLASLKQFMEAEPREIDAMDDCILTQSGIVSLRTGEVTTNRKEDMMISETNCKISNRKPKMWLEHIKRVFDGDDDMVDSFHRAVGYTITGLIIERCLFLAYGPGRNGKSVTMEVLKHILGDYQTTIPLTFLLGERSGPDPTYLDLRVARLACASEVQEVSTWNEATVKGLTGGDTVVGRTLYAAENVSFVPRAKFWVLLNSLPAVKDSSPAFWDRIRIFPFLRRFTEEEVDKYMYRKLTAEAPEILGWMVKGAVEYYANGLAEADQSIRHREEYQSAEDEITQFLEEKGYSIPGSSDTAIWMTHNELYTQYEQWCELNHIGFPKGKKSFGSKLTTRGYPKKKDGKGRMEYAVEIDR